MSTRVGRYTSSHLPGPRDVGGVWGALPRYEVDEWEVDVVELGEVVGEVAGLEEGWDRFDLH